MNEEETARLTLPQEAPEKGRQKQQKTHTGMNKSAVSHHFRDHQQ